MIGCPDCSSDCNATAIIPTTCPYGHVCLNLTQGAPLHAFSLSPLTAQSRRAELGYVHHQMTLSQGSNQYYTLTYTPCINLALVVFPSVGSAELYMNQDQPNTTTGNAVWSEYKGDCSPLWHEFCCYRGSQTFLADQPLYLNVIGATDVSYDLYIYDMSVPLPAKFFYKHGTGLIHNSNKAGSIRCATSHLMCMFEQWRW